MEEKLEILFSRLLGQVREESFHDDELHGGITALITLARSADMEWGNRLDQRYWSRLVETAPEV